MSHIRIKKSIADLAITRSKFLKIMMWILKITILILSLSIDWERTLLTSQLPGNEINLDICYQECISFCPVWCLGRPVSCCLFLHNLMQAWNITKDVVRGLANYHWRAKLRHSLALYVKFYWNTVLPICSYVMCGLCVALSTAAFVP